ncbi:hypothetical protein ACQ86G_30355 [Roseateles chitinivorans]|uniref:hypothetical protein n=1 Tax=Roseateles chitinivorans TaxID=2917965 RepID=UPI003D6690E2
MYVVLMMAVVEAFSSQGTVLGALITFVFYGVVPLSIVMYLMGTPRRRAARRKAEASGTPHDDGEGAVAPMPTTRPASTSTSPPTGVSAQPDDGRHASAAQSADALVAERKES